MAIAERTTPRMLRCAIYTRKSTEKGLEQEFNSLDAQREACEAYILSQKHAGWVALSEPYDDGGFSGGNMERPAMQKLISDIERGKIDSVVVYKIDRISRSLLDFAKLMELFERHNVSFTSITQQFSTDTAMGRLTLNILLSFAAFEREIAAERVKDKVTASRKKGKYCGGRPPFGYDVDYTHKRLVVNPEEAKTVQWMFKRYTEIGSCLDIARELDAKGITTKTWITKKGTVHDGGKWSSYFVYRALNSPTYLGFVEYEGERYPGEHEAIISQKLWDAVQRTKQAKGDRKSTQETHENKSLLRGIIRCGHCDQAMIGSYTKRGEKVYRYYVCNHAAKHGYKSCPVASVPAGDIEEAVLGQLRRIMQSPEMVAQTFHALGEMQRTEDDPDASGVTEAEVLESFGNIDSVWNELFPAEQQRIFHALVERVWTTIGGIDITIRADGLHSLAAELR